MLLCFILNSFRSELQPNRSTSVQTAADREEKDDDLFVCQHISTPQGAVFRVRYVAGLRKAFPEQALQALIIKLFNLPIRIIDRRALKKEMVLSGVEFIRRFALHILTKGFVRIRYFGMLSNAVKQTTLTTIREQLTPEQNRVQKEEPASELFAPIEAICPCCKMSRMQLVMDFDHRGPPIELAVTS